MPQGKELQVLFEDERTDGKMKGFTSNYVRVLNDYDQARVNNLINVKITGLTETGMCSGNILDTKNSIELISL